MKVMEVPAQTGPVGEEVIFIEAVELGVTVTAIALDVTAIPEAQTELGVMMQVTVSLLLNVALVYVEAFVPTGEPFSSHW